MIGSIWGKRGGGPACKEIGRLCSRRATCKTLGMDLHGAIDPVPIFFPPLLKWERVGGRKEVHAFGYCQIGFMPPFIGRSMLDMNQASVCSLSKEIGYSAAI